MAKRIDRVVGVLGVILLNSMLILGIMQVLRRYVDLPIAVYWTGEVSRTFLALITLISLPYLFVHDADISFLPLLKNVISNLDVLLLIRNMFLAFLSAILVWSAYLAVGAAGDTGLPTLQWFKLWWGYAFIGMSFGTLLVYVLIDTRERIKQVIGETDKHVSGNKDV